ncbi:hypothetical protein ACFY1B_08820 [Streptomyces mirabilis]|uniref:hypothetical protein n=1 Tax=Streptomyces mirabilis TaxID=68239 RepID=UPI00367998EB
MHPESSYEITTATQPRPHPLAYQADWSQPPRVLPEELPPGVQVVTLPGGMRTLARRRVR